MNCDAMTEMLSDRLKGLLDADAEHALAEHLAGCTACREEATAVEQLWNRMGDLDEEIPSDRMRARFYASLSAYQEAEPTGLLRAIRESFARLWPRQPAYQLGLSLATLLIGLILGARLAPGSAGEIESLRGEMQQMGQAISLTLLEHQSASKRLRGVDWSQRTGPDDQVVSALLDAVRGDDSVNVRLAASRRWPRCSSNRGSVANYSRRCRNRTRR